MGNILNNPEGKAEARPLDQASISESKNDRRQLANLPASRESNFKELNSSLLP